MLTIRVSRLLVGYWCRWRVEVTPNTHSALLSTKSGKSANLSVIRVSLACSTKTW